MVAALIEDEMPGAKGLRGLRKQAPGVDTLCRVRGLPRDRVPGKGLEDVPSVRSEGHWHH